MDFPRFVFKDKGPLQRQGGSYSETLVLNQSEMDAALLAGWFATLPEALEPHEEPRTGPGTEVQATGDGDDDAPPTRAELEAKAHELGIEFSQRIGDKKLLERIEEAIKAKAQAPEV